MEIVYWHWLVLGILLVILEIVVPSFTILWFGLGAMVVGVLLWLVPQLPIVGQLLVWILASGGFALYWFKYLKPRMVDKTLAGLSREAAIGESGRVIKLPVEHGRGIVRFTTPLLGADEWEFICDQTLSLGDRVFVKEFSGNNLVVVKLD